MARKNTNHHYLRNAAIFGALGWGLFFATGGAVALGYAQYAVYMGAASLIVGWGISGYFWVRYGLENKMGAKNLALTILGRKRAKG